MKNTILHVLFIIMVKLEKIFPRHFYYDKISYCASFPESESIIIYLGTYNRFEVTKRYPDPIDMLEYSMECATFTVPF